MKRALCVGINKFSDPGNDLEFCVDDAKLWGLVLGNLGFEVEYLFDGDATVSGIKSALIDLLDASVDGDVLVWTASHHGTQAMDISGDEMDGWDEALFVHDGMIVDDEIRAIIDAYTKPGVSVVVILDCCFSGTATRSVRSPMPRDKRTRRVRFVPNPKVGALVPKRRRYLEGDMVEVLWSACDDEEYSYEDVINGVGHGLFTYYATKAISGNLPGLTYEQLNEIVGQDLPSTDYPQTPQIEGKNKGQQAFVPAGDGDSGNGNGNGGNGNDNGNGNGEGDNEPPTGTGCIPALLFSMFVASGLVIFAILLVRVLFAAD